MIEASEIYDTATSMENLGAILRVVADFDSYQTQASSRLPFESRRLKELEARQAQKKDRVDRIMKTREEVKHRLRSAEINSQEIAPDFRANQKFVTA